MFHYCSKMARQLPPTDPHIQAFTILSDRVSNLEDNISSIKAGLCINEMRKSGKLCNTLLGYPFAIRCLRADDMGDEGAFFDSAVVEISCICPVSCPAEMVPDDKLGTEVENIRPTFSAGYVLPSDENWVAFGLISESPDLPNLADYVDEALRMYALRGHTRSCVREVIINPCDRGELMAFVEAIKFQLGCSTVGPDLFKFAYWSRWKSMKRNPYFSMNSGWFANCERFMQTH